MYIVVKTEVMNISTNMGERVVGGINNGKYMRNKKKGERLFSTDSKGIPKGFQNNNNKKKNREIKELTLSIYLYQQITF